ncbi:hypothetical protein H4R19_005261, partial [Coemansia spiralis]
MRVLSERTRLSATALLLVEELARQMEMRFQPLCDLLFPSVMRTCGRANKVFVTRGLNCLTTVITYAHVPEQTPNICSAAASDPSKTVRTSAAKLLMSIVSCCTVPELTPHLALVEKAIAEGIVDANPEARTTARQSYEIYIKRFSDRVDQFHASLSATGRKYLKIADKVSDGSQPASGRPAAAHQRQPLRDRIAAQRASANPTTTAGQGGATAAPALGPQRPKPVRPIARPVPAAARKTDTSAAAAAALPLALDGADVAPKKASEEEPPALGAKSSSLENVLMSPSSTKPTLPRLFGDDTSGTSTPIAEVEQAEPSPHDSGNASVSPTASGPDSRAPTPDAKGEADDKAAVAQSGDKGGKAPAAIGKGAAPRAKRGPGLSFSSLGSAASRAGTAARPQARNQVSARVEEALRAQRPGTQGAAADDQRRMTLRSDTRRASLDPRGQAAAPTANAGPGYLRATASSAQRVTESAGAMRGTKRRKRSGAADDCAAQAPPKAAK